MITLFIVGVGGGCSTRVFKTWIAATRWAYHQYTVDCEQLIGCEARNLMVHRSPGGVIEWSTI